jgi:hypothetical protein
MKDSIKVTQYYSKWRKCWVHFSDRYGVKYLPNKEEIAQFKKHGYKLR